MTVPFISSVLVHDLPPFPVHAATGHGQVCVIHARPVEGGPRLSATWSAARRRTSVTVRNTTIIALASAVYVIPCMTWSRNSTYRTPSVRYSGPVIVLSMLFMCHAFFAGFPEDRLCVAGTVVRDALRQKGRHGMPSRAPRWRTVSHGTPRPGDGRQSHTRRTDLPLTIKRGRRTDGACSADPRKLWMSSWDTHSSVYYNSV